MELSENMKSKRYLCILSLLVLAIISVGCVAASEDNNLTDDSLSVEIDDESNNDVLSVSQQDSISESQTIIVDEFGGDYNEMNQHTIRNAINSANAGDTIIVNGESYVHVHVLIDKQLTIKSNIGTSLSPCSSTAYSNYRGAFYLTEKASGTIIEGFNFNDDGMLDDGDYSILIDGASDVIIRNCTFSNGGYGDAIRIVNANNILITNVTVSDAINGVKFVNSQNSRVTESKIKNSNYGIDVVDSTKIDISSNDISNNKISGVAIAGTSSNVTTSFNNLTHNVVAINFTSSEYMDVLSNYIAYSTNGIYINCNVTKIQIKGNFFNQNSGYEVLNDHRVKNLINPTNTRIGYPDLEIIDNNYMVGLEGAEEERPVYRIVYNYVGSNRGDYNYDAANDVYNYVGSTKGSYLQSKGAVFLRYVFEINKNVNCPVIYFDYSSGSSWSLSGNYELQLSELTQVKKGLYSISIVDENGNVASDLSSVPVTFYLNKQSNSVGPQEGDVYKTVMVKNGTATVRFAVGDFKESGNIVTAVFPTNGAKLDSKIYKTLTIADDNIPGSVTNSTVTLTDLNTYPNSNQVITATLTDANGKAIVGEILTFTLNSKTSNVTTDSNGQAQLPVYISKEGTYIATVTFNSDESEYYESSATSKVVVKKTNTKIISSNLNMIPNMAEYYSITLKDASGKPISGQNVKFTVNGKTYAKKTNSNGVAKVSLKFSKNKKTYKITIKFAGGNKYNSASKTNKIVVKYSSKTAKLSAPTVTVTPKTSKTYTVTLKDANSKAISKQNVKIKVNGKTYTKKTNSKGQASINVKFTSLKTYKVSVSYAGSKIYKNASANGKIKVAKTVTKFTAPTVLILPKQAKTYTATLKTSAGKVLSKHKVTLKVNGKTYTKTTNSKGQVSISVNFASEKTYPVVLSYGGTAIYKAAKATGQIKVAKSVTNIFSYDKTYAKDAAKNYQITLKDSSGKSLSGQTLTYTIGNDSFTKVTDSNGQINIDFSNQTGDSYIISIKYGGNNQYKSSSNASTITISNKTNVIFVDDGLPNSEIQNILDSASSGSNIEFLGDSYFDIALDVKNSANIYSSDKTILVAKINTPVFNVLAEDTNITNFVLKGNSGDAVDVNANKVVLSNNYIWNTLDESKTPDYVNGTVNMPGYGVNIINSSDVKLVGNSISLFESGIFAEYSNNLIFDNNTLRENNYGVKYGFGVFDTQIINNEISHSTGLYIMTVPEGPSGYGIFLNNSAVNVVINNNHISKNHLGISLDANYSTGIVITQNIISDNVLEGIRFNAGYDLAENAAEPVVTDNAIYRNAVGPSMMILGEMSANPEGIYGNGLYNASDKLQLAPNWYGTNTLVTWDYDTGVVGYGTMCPRINTTAIKFDNLTYNSPGNYSIVFYKNGEIASNLPEFDMYATLNRGTAKEAEVNFNVLNGVGTFNFNANNYGDVNNIIEISVGSLLDSTYRTFKITSKYEVPQSEIPV